MLKQTLFKKTNDRFKNIETDYISNHWDKQRPRRYNIDVTTYLMIDSSSLIVSIMIWTTLSVTSLTNLFLLGQGQIFVYCFWVFYNYKQFIINNTITWNFNKNTHISYNHNVANLVGFLNLERLTSLSNLSNGRLTMKEYQP